MFRWKRKDCRGYQTQGQPDIRPRGRRLVRRNGARPIRGEFKDRSVSGKTHTSLGCVEVADAVESQAPALTRNGAEDDPFSIWCELEDCAGRCGTVVIIRHDIGIARDVYGKAFKEKLSGERRLNFSTLPISRRSPGSTVSAAKRLPMLSKANPRGNNNPEA